MLGLNCIINLYLHNVSGLIHYFLRIKKIIIIDTYTVRIICSLLDAYGTGILINNFVVDKWGEKRREGLKKLLSFTRENTQRLHMYNGA